MNKLITELNESIKWKLEDIKKYSKMIDLVITKDVKGIRKFIYECETCEKEMFFELLDLYYNELFHKVYPNAEVGTSREYAVSIIHDQFVVEKNEEKKFGIDFKNGYPEDWCDEQYPESEERCKIDKEKQKENLEQVAKTWHAVYSK